MTAKEMLAMVGRTGELYLRESGLTIYVQIHDVRTAFGRVDYEVSPLQGSGTTWVSADRVKPRTEMV